MMAVVYGISNYLKYTLYHWFESNNVHWDLRVVIKDVKNYFYNEILAKITYNLSINFTLIDWNYKQCTMCASIRCCDKDFKWPMSDIWLKHWCERVAPFIISLTYEYQHVIHSARAGYIDCLSIMTRPVLIRFDVTAWSATCNSN